MADGEEERQEIHIPFLSDDPNYALGFEMGILFAQMHMMEAKAIEARIHSLNEEQLQVIAGCLGYKMLGMDSRNEPEGWTLVELYKE